MQTGRNLDCGLESSEPGLPASAHPADPGPSGERLVRGALAVCAVAALFSIALGIPGAASAQEEDRFDNEVCLACHDVPSVEVPLPSGETLNAVVERETYETSVHGRLDLPCVLCHTAIEGFPHPSVTAESLRAYAVERYTACFGCHQGEYTATADNVHAKARAAGDQEAAICTDCHGAHDAAAPSGSGIDIALTCRTCHSQIYDLYADSVHGAALTAGETDVPTCTDCHGVHDAEGPENPEFHLFSPQICATCHADEELMAKYGISTQVFDTYVADFHGTTVLLFEELAPDQETNKPVCIDCHGVHHIVATDDPDSTVFKENLLSTCQRCHPEATANFPTAWLSHYQPTPDKEPLVFGVGIFYRILIPLVIGTMLLYVLLDIARRARTRRRPERVANV